MPVKANPVLQLDAETQADLKLFGPGDDTLFAYCNRCRTDAGRKVLRRRMETPSASAEQICATQRALLFVLEHRAAFEELPSAYLALNTERYLTAVYPVVRQTASVDFHLAALFFRVHEDQFYTKIIHGVELTRRFLAALRALTRAVQPDDAAGELEPLLKELRSVLERPGLMSLYGAPEPDWYWQRLRVDQVFRLVEKAHLVRLLQLAAEIDALVSLADVFSANGLVMPELVHGDVAVNADGLIHPLLPGAVPNDVHLDASSRVLFLTGPNMAGKTTYLRALAIALYFAHLGLGVPARRFRFVPVERLFTAITLVDDLTQGISYFRAEALRMKAIAQAMAAGQRTVAVLDEPFKGTNVKDAFDATSEVIRRLARAPTGLFVITSHLIEISDALRDCAGVVFGFFEANEQGRRLAFDYRLKAGVSSQRLGMRVLQEEGVLELLDGGHPADG